jgi:hypothetical protein
MPALQDSWGLQAFFAGAKKRPLHGEHSDRKEEINGVARMKSGDRPNLHPGLHPGYKSGPSHR